MSKLGPIDDEALDGPIWKPNSQVSLSRRRLLELDALLGTIAKSNRMWMIAGSHLASPANRPVACPVVFELDTPSDFLAPDPSRLAK